MRSHKEKEEENAQWSRTIGEFLILSLLSMREPRQFVRSLVIYLLYSVLHSAQCTVLTSSS